MNASAHSATMQPISSSSGLAVFSEACFLADTKDKAS